MVLLLLACKDLLAKYHNDKALVEGIVRNKELESVHVIGYIGLFFSDRRLRGSGSSILMWKNLGCMCPGAACS